MAAPAITLYYVPRTRAVRPRWLLEELGVPYELRRLDVGAQENRRPVYLAIHPHGQVPALREGEVVLFESMAICAWLADRFPDRGMAPPVASPLRARYYQWLAYGPATLEPAISQVFQHTTQLPEAQRVAALAEKGRERFAECAAVLAAAIDPFVLGASFSAADVVIGANLIWARRVGLLEGRPALEDYVARLRDRPAAQRAFAD